ncbi:MAG: hypothetical protein J6L88_03525 [Clostridia bacterium]|nr:hypothetical protein [Clostridia bacterium]
MKKMFAKAIAAVLLTFALVLTGCACRSYNNEVIEQTPTPSPTQEMEALPTETPTPSPVAMGTYSFSHLEQDETGTTTNVVEKACTLHYNADMFEVDEVKSSEYLAAFTTNGGIGVDYVTVRLVPAKDDFGMMADCFDYFELQREDEAEPDDLESMQTKIGRVTYYITTSDLEGDGETVRAYYALNLGDAAFCGTMDIAMDAEAMLLDTVLMEEYAEEFFDEGIADTVFENLFMNVEVDLPQNTAAQ